MTDAEITQIKAEITAYNTAILESIPTGSVTEFRQGSTYIVKASTKELKRTRDQLLNELHIMGEEL